jgi:bifunctional DNA-binding transcriptional regulator/antitoxin component of YhaV-PrlF toxin-antitoxin module
MAKPLLPTASQEGFAEDQARYEATSNVTRNWKIKVGSDGRFVIPAAARALMDIPEDGTVTASIQDGELRIISQRAAIRRVQAFIKANRKGSGSMADELIAERRAAAERGD